MHERSPPPRPLGRLPHGKPNLRRCRAAEESAASANRVFAPSQKSNAIFGSLPKLQVLIHQGVRACACALFLHRGLVPNVCACVRYVSGRSLVLFRGLRIPEEPFTNAVGIPIEGAHWYGAHFLLRRFAPAPCALSQGAIPGAYKGAGYIPRLFATILLTGCVLFARWVCNCCHARDGTARPEQQPIEPRPRDDSAAWDPADEAHPAAPGQKRPPQPGHTFHRHEQAWKGDPRERAACMVHEDVGLSSAARSRPSPQPTQPTRSIALKQVSSDLRCSVLQKEARAPA